MPDLDQVLREDGAAWRSQVDALRAPHASEFVQASAGTPSRSPRWRSPVAAVLVTLIVAALVTYVSTRGSSGGHRSVHKPPADVQGQIPDSMFTVAGPDISGVMGPAPMQQPDCTPAQIDATAEVRPSAYGLVGVVEMHGQQCSIGMAAGPTALIDATGDRLDIPVAPDVGRNGANMRPDLSFAAGDGAWGFALTGSWCGPAPVAVVVMVSDVRELGPPVGPSITVPFTGPTPPCTGTSDATLVRGVPGGTGEAVLPAPAAWSSLAATLRVPTTAPYLQDLSVTLTNSSDEDVRLSPCPRFSFAVDRTYAGGDSSTVGGPGGLLPCDASTIVPAHGQLVLPFTVHGFGDDGGPATNGPVVKTTIRFAIAGGASASVTREG